MPGERIDTEGLRKLDALLVGNNYDDETIERLLPHVLAYFEAREALCSLPLGEVKNFSVMLAGGER